MARRALSFGFSFCLAALAFAGCSSGTTSTATGPGNDPTKPGVTQPGADGGKPATGDGGTNVTSKFTCCLNDVFYKCPDKAATDQCAFGGFDMGACMDECAKNPSDFSCMEDCDAQLRKAKPDPSACTEQPGEKCPETKPGTPLCSNVGTGSCTYDSECGSGRHCNGGSCYDNEAGSKCTYDSQCGSGNHCTDGCCQGNEVGTSCTYDSQCGSGNHCTDGKCHANESGSPCVYDSQCGSGSSCVDGTCN